MKRRKIIGLGLVLSLLLAGCGQGGSKEDIQETTVQETEDTTDTSAENKIYLSQMDVSDLVELGTYKGVEVEVASVQVPETMVDSYMEYMLSLQSELTAVTDRDTVEEGDTVTIDYVGKQDGVAFDGGTDTDAKLEIGSGSFINGFEDGLIGVKKGETVELNLTFPADYWMEDMAGKEVVFTVTVKEIETSVTPELTDEYVVSLGMEGVSTVEEYRQTVHEMLVEEMQAEYEYQVQVAVVEKVMANSQIQDPAEELQKKYADVAMRQMQSAADYYGMELESYVKSAYGIELAQYETEINAGAFEAAKQAMLCKKIADVEGIEVADEELDAAVEENYASLGYGSAQDFKSGNDMEEYRDSILLNKIIEFLVSNAVISEPAGTE
ncbi:MAG: trigger factor [Lachnospiraceae bacterium]